MDRNVLEVLMYLFDQHMDRDADISKNEMFLASELLELGFGSHSISQAMQWLQGCAMLER